MSTQCAGSCFCRPIAGCPSTCPWQGRLCCWWYRWCWSASGLVSAHVRVTCTTQFREGQCCLHSGQGHVLRHTYSLSDLSRAHTNPVRPAIQPVNWTRQFVPNTIHHSGTCDVLSMLAAWGVKLVVAERVPELWQPVLYSSEYCTYQPVETAIQYSGYFLIQ